MSEKKDHTELIQKHIRDLDSHLNEVVQDFDGLMDIAFEYAAENPGDYFMILPGLILPIFT